MTRNLKATGLACFAVLALGALGAQGASANVLHHFKVGASSADITATGDPNEPTIKWFSAPGGVAIECENAHGEGTQSEETVTEGEATGPLYTGCDAFGFALTITDNGCKLRLHAETSEDSSTEVENAPADFNCGGGTGNTTLTVPAIGCTIKFSDRSKAGATVNQGLHGVHYVNTQTAGEPETITAEVHIHGIHYEASGCGLAGVANGTHTTGTLIGKATAKAYISGSEHTAENQIDDTIITT